MDNNIFKKIEEEQLKKRPDVRVGDTVKLHIRVKEGNKERIQIFEGTVIAIRGEGLNKSMTVRKISYGIGVEKIVQLHSPILSKIEVVKRGSVSKAKLFYLRDRVGKRALKINKIQDMYETDEVEEVKEEPVEEVKEEVVEEKAE
ncbi:MAG TPA: 50S ribosomal protein L19 [Candidatus Dojkabacteria bacterium]|nr:50S ribosomal protein L19 [Candidatus Dojkabacteria bacterium]